MHKDNLTAVVYSSGLIEGPIINREIIDVLEGTRPAFEKRSDKYHAWLSVKLSAQVPESNEKFCHLMTNFPCKYRVFAILLRF